MNDLCFLDLETTGFDAELDSIIEISFVRYKDGELVSTFDQVCKPDKSALSPIVTQITGITQEELDQNGKVFSDLLPQIQELIGESTIVGHNIDFDIKFLKANGLNLDKNARLDTHEIARIVLINEESYALEVLSTKYEFTHENAHRAMSDVLASKDLLNFLIPKIKTLPKAYFTSVKPVLEASNWGAKDLFLKVNLDSNPGFTNDISASNPGYDSDPNPASTNIPLPAPGPPQLLRIQNAAQSAQDLVSLTQAHPDKTFIITTSKRSFFKGLQSLYPPHEILSAEKLEAFGKAKQDWNDPLITFYLKLQLRNHLGLKEKRDGNLFFIERDWWQDVCVMDQNDKTYASYLEKKLKERVLLTSHQDFITLLQQDQNILDQDRILLIDEGEDFVRQLIMGANKSYDLGPYLDSKDKKVAQRTHFFVGHFCKQVLEKTLDHQINPFPLKLRLPTHKYDKLAEVARDISEDQMIQDFAHVLETPTDYDLRWAYYKPDNGYLTLNTWNKADWESLLKALAQTPTLISYRHNLEDQELNFFQTFCNPSCERASLPVVNPIKVTVPEGVMAATSPDYYEYCARKIVEVFESKCQDGGWIAVNCSSQTIMRSIFELVSQKLQDHPNTKILGERLSGGDGKVEQILKANQDKKGVFFYQNFLYPILEEIDFKAVILQKFPFPFPHPIIEYLETKLEQKGLNFWELWTMPLVATKISKNLSGFSDISEMIVIDPRENSRWAQSVWKRFE